MAARKGMDAFCPKTRRNFLARVLDQDLHAGFFPKVLDCTAFPESNKITICCNEKMGKANIKIQRCLIASIMRKDGTTGVQTHFNSLKNGLKALDVDTVFLNSFSAYKLLHFPIYAIRPIFFKKSFKSFGVWWYRYWHFLFLYFALKKYLNNNDVDIVNAQCPLSAIAALKLKNKLKLNYKVILTCHFNISQADEFLSKNEIVRNSRLYDSICAIEKDVLTQADGVVFVSKFSKKQITRFHGVSNANSIVINNGIAPQKISPQKDKSDIGIDTSFFIITSVGTLEPRKNQKFLLEMFAVLLKKDPTYLLLLVGDGQDRAELQNFIDKNKLQNNIKLLGFRKDIESILSITDLYCHPAKMENFPISIVEALGFGLPVLASPVGGIPEIITHGKNGFLIDTSKDKINEYVNQIETLRKNPLLYKSFSRAAKKYFLSHLTEKSMAEKYLVRERKQ
jgi:glycosyltransferase involved in cell wall biosynthesis